MQSSMWQKINIAYHHKPATLLNMVEATSCCEDAFLQMERTDWAEHLLNQWRPANNWKRLGQMFIFHQDNNHKQPELQQNGLNQIILKDALDLNSI